MKSVLAVVLGGGVGTRLFPLTHVRSKPAVPFGAKYRIIDVPLSNCLHSNINRIFILTQYNSASLNHHVTSTYRFSIFSRGFVNILAAEQRADAMEWFQGTADAVRQSLHHLKNHAFQHLLVISGDQLYQMDFNEVLAAHVERGADVTVATTPVTARDATAFGIMRTDEHRRIVEFVEKPSPERLAALASDTGRDLAAEGRVYLASMGMYVFDRDVLFGLLNDHPDLHDFGRDIIPLAIQRLPVHGYPFDGYWTDIGTIGSFFEANLALCEALPRLNLYDADRPIYTHARQLPPSKLQQCRLDRAIVGEGAVLEGCEIERCVVGVRSIVAHGARLKDSVVLGADFHESPAERQKNARLGRPDVGIGAGTHLERCIIDKNARVGRNVFIRGGDGRPDADGDGWHVRDGIVVVVKDGTIPDGTVI